MRQSSSERFTNAKCDTVIAFAYSTINTDIYIFGGQHFETYTSTNTG
jgi:hypothetical protein